MKVLHLCLANFYIDKYSYQENLLPKFHNKMGLDVEIIASLVSFDKDGEPSLLKKSGTYSNEFGIPVTRLEYKKTVLSRRLRRYTGTYEALIKAKPDVIFIHGCQFIDIRQVVKYARENPNVEIFVDNHADFSNSARNFLSKNVLHKIVWRYCARTIEPYTTKFYGVLPARVDFLKNVYKIPEEKIELLLMGADDEKVIEAQDDVMRIDIRKKYGIKPTDFLIMTGGKIDLAKKQTLLLMQAIKELDRKDIKLIVFGSIVEELKNEVEYLSDGEKIQYIGWIDAEDSYKYFSASDLVVFPGRHSVFWEQVVALGIPMIVKYWDGTNHIDIGGNCKFLHEDSVQEIADAIRELAKDNFKIYKCMKKSALNEEHNEFLYSSIANQSLQISNNSAGNKTQNER